MTESNINHVVVQHDDGVCTIAFDRPEKKNALTRAMYTAATEALQAASDHKQTRVVVVTGRGGSFTAGNDLADFMNDPPTSPETPVFRFLQALVGLEKPLVAAVPGAAVGVGTTLLLHCDLAYAARSAVFRLPFVNLGLCPEAASSFLLPRILGHTRAAELLMFGDKFDAETARSAGLINEVVDDDTLDTHVAARARALASKPPAALRLTKRLMKAATHEQISATMLKEGHAFLDCLRSPEAAEAFKAFFQGREPDFSFSS